MDGGLRRLASVSCPNTYIAGLRKPGFQRGRAFVHDPQSDTVGLIPVTCWALPFANEDISEVWGFPAAIDQRK